MFEGIKAATLDNKRKVSLQNPMDLTTLHKVLTERIDPGLFGEPVLTTGFLNKAITYAKQDRVTPRVTVKDRTVTILKVTDGSKSTVSVGKIGMTLNKGLRGKAGVKTALGGHEYFAAVADAVTEALKGM